MKQTMMIPLPARKDIPATSIYTEIYSKNAIGHRDTLILVPGGPGNDRTMYDTPVNSIAKSLTPYVDIILFDPRGCGNSEKSDAKYCTLEHYIDDLESIREHFKISPNHFLMFGQSYGSIAALGYAIRYASNLKKLLLIGGATSGEFLEQAKHNLSKIGTPEQKRFAEKLWTGTFIGSLEEVAEYYRIMGPLYSTTFKPDPEFMKTAQITYNVEVLNLGFSDFLRKFDYRSKLSKIRCKTLILWGEDEWIFDRKQIKTMHEDIPGSELVVYSHCGHMLWIDQWEKFLAKTVEFLTESKGDKE